jgi:hypothetical protein
MSIQNFFGYGVRLQKDAPAWRAAFARYNEANSFAFALSRSRGYHEEIIEVWNLYEDKMITTWLDGELWR